MSYRPWHDFVRGKEYALAEVVASCSKHINSGEVEDQKQKKQYLEQIKNSGHAVIRYSPVKEGWGSSPMNPDSWRTRNGNPICKTVKVSKSRKS